jgi:hypothetical protein
MPDRTSVEHTTLTGLWLSWEPIETALLHQSRDRTRPVAGIARRNRPGFQEREPPTLFPEPAPHLACGGNVVSCVPLALGFRPGQTSQPVSGGFHRNPAGNGQRTCGFRRHCARHLQPRCPLSPRRAGRIRKQRRCALHRTGSFLAFWLSPSRRERPAHRRLSPGSAGAEPPSLGFHRETAGSVRAPERLSPCRSGGWLRTEAAFADSSPWPLVDRKVLLPSRSTGKPPSTEKAEASQGPTVRSCEGKACADLSSHLRINVKNACAPWHRPLPRIK